MTTTSLAVLRLFSGIYVTPNIILHTKMSQTSLESGLTHLINDLDDIESLIIFRLSCAIGMAILLW